MSAPRRIVPYAIYLLTRRCAQRMFMLRPDEHTNKVVRYCLAEAARRYDIDLIAWMFMSNHYHAVVHDSSCQIAAFLGHFHKMMAKALNHRWARKENFWSSTETCVTLLPTLEDVLRKVVYVLTNPVKANLVETVEDWPGESSWDYLDFKARTHARPEHYFRKVRKPWQPERMPLFADLEAVPPAMNGEQPISSKAWVEQVRAAVADKEKALRFERKLAKIEVLTAEKVLEQEHDDRPETEEPPCELRPTVACRDKKLRGQELAKIRFFRIHYKRSRLLFRDGDRSVLFPIGTYHMRRLGARCMAPPD